MSDIKLEGKTLPNTTFKVRVKNDQGEYEWKNVELNSLTKGKKIVIFALPGAYTPTCSSTHLPGYEMNYESLKKEGVDEVYCLSVNDSFVMNSWAKDQGVNKVKMIPDGNAEFTKEIGMAVKKENLGFGLRSWRYSMLVEDGIIKKAFIEEGLSDNFESDPFEVSDATTMLDYLKNN